MTGQCLKCMKAFGKLFRSIVVSNVNSLPQQALVFHENILSIYEFDGRQRLQGKKLLSDTLYLENWFRKDPHDKRIVLA